LVLVEALVAEERLDEAVAVLEQVTVLPQDFDSLIKTGRADGLIAPPRAVLK